jgi:hypothetical protein
MRFAALALAACLGACVISSKAPLLDPANAVEPFADGARFVWTSGDGDTKPISVAYRLIGEAAYEIDALDGGEAGPLRPQFFDVPETPEEDYLVQVQMEPGEDWTYAFMWRHGDEHLIYFSPAILDHGPRPDLRQTHCVTLAYQQCELSTAEGLRAIYLDLVYPSYVQYGLRQGVLVQTPMSAASEETNSSK